MTGRYSYLPPKNPPKREAVLGDDSLPRNPIFDRKTRSKATLQHLVHDIESGRNEQGQNIDVAYHASSNAKLAALAYIIRKRSPDNIQQGLDYIKQNQSRFKDIMSQSHNDAMLIEVAKAMNYSKLPLFEDAMQPLKRNAQGHQINYIRKAHPDTVHDFFDAYHKDFMKYRADFNVDGSRIFDPIGNADPKLHNGTTEISPRDIAHLVDYLYKLDKGKTLKSLLNPSAGNHTTAGYLGRRDKPGNGQVFFAKTGSIATDEYSYLPKDSPVREQFPNGVYLLTMGYMQDGKPKMVTFRADSADQRKTLANKFLDDVAGIKPAQKAELKRAQPKVAT
ncbi:MAG: hypothetical protein K2Q32_10010 [Alphaproteobacteria bacterium]|nr:hypothetical protein [Alphaproteobacteria bacterium]